MPEKMESLLADRHGILFSKRSSKSQKKGLTPIDVRPFEIKSGGDLLSHPVAQAVSSAREGLTSVFGMGTGVSPPPWPPKTAFAH